MHAKEIEMLGNHLLEKAKILTKQYPDIFAGNVYAASSYLVVVKSVKELDIEFKKDEPEGAVLTKELLSFLETKIQFQSKTNLYLVMEDVIRFARVCFQQDSNVVKQHARDLLRESDNIMTHLSEIMFSNFEYTNFSALSELNMQILEEYEKKEEQSAGTATSTAVVRYK